MWLHWIAWLSIHPLWFITAYGANQIEMLKFPIYSVLVSQEATSSPEGSSTLLGGQLPSQDGKWKEAGFFFFSSFFWVAGILLNWSCLSLCVIPCPLCPLASRGSLKGQLEPLNEVSEFSDLFRLACNQEMLAFHFGVFCGAVGMLNIKQQPDVDNSSVSMPF